MEFFKRLTNLDFMGFRRWTAVLSTLMFVFALWSLWQKGLNLGLDFTGGLRVELHHEKEAIDLETTRRALEKIGLHRVAVQTYGSTHDVLLSLPPSKTEDQKILVAKIASALPDIHITRVEYVGPQVGKELASRGAAAVLASLIATMIYILFRFEYGLAVSSTVR